GAKDLAEDYQKLFQSIVDVKMKLENLDEIRKNISIERYEILKNEYNSFLNTAEPELDDLLKEIDSKIEILIMTDKEIVDELMETWKSIRQEDRIFKAIAISARGYREKITPLKAKLNQLGAKHRYKQSQIKILIAAKNHQHLPLLEEYNENPPGSSPRFYKNPSHATALSFFWMGLGQVYNGQILKGIGFIIFYSISVALISVNIGFITTPTLWIWGMVDANKTAKAINS
ncbi:MAG: hypothetical protein GX103_12765, partial [Bacteroidales bacterium]|nr:hypothetical protein [Bacteroidales bacterium]